MNFFAGGFITTEALIYFIISSFLYAFGPFIILAALYIVISKRKNKTKNLFKAAVVALIIITPPTIYIHTTLAMSNFKAAKTEAKHIDMYFDSLPDFYLPVGVTASKSTISLTPEQPGSGYIKLGNESLEIEKIADLSLHNAAEKFLDCANATEPACRKIELSDNKSYYTKKLTPNPYALEPRDFTRVAIVIKNSLIIGSFESSSQEDLIKNYAQTAVMIPRSTIKKIYSDEKFLKGIERVTY